MSFIHYHPSFAAHSFPTVLDLARLRPAHLRPATLSRYVRAATLFEARMGPMPCPTIRAHHADAFCRALEKDRSRSYVHDTLSMLARLVQEGRLHAGLAEGANPFREVAGRWRRPEPKAVPRTVSESDLNRSFHSGPYQGPLPVDGQASSAWLVLVALSTAGRPVELLHARPHDVEQMEGTWGIRLAAPSVGYGGIYKEWGRCIPLGGELKRCGFLEYVEDRKRQGRPWLFTDELVARDGASRLCGWVRRHLRANAQSLSLSGLRNTLLLALFQRCMDMHLVYVFAGRRTGIPSFLPETHWFRHFAELTEVPLLPALDLSHLYR